MICATNFNPIQIHGSAIAPQQHFFYIGGDVSTITFNGVLSPDNIIPEILSSPGGGTFTATISETDFSWDINYTGLYQNFSGPTNFYLQGPATPENNGSIIYDLTSFSTFVPPNLEGERVVSPLISKIIKSGESYINIPTVRYPNGEVRGNLDLINSDFSGPILHGSADVFGPLTYTSNPSTAIEVGGTFDGSAVYNNYVVETLQPQNLDNSLIFTGTINATQNIPVSSSVRTGLLFCHYHKQTKELSYSFTYSGTAFELSNCRIRGPATTTTNGPIILEIPITGSAIRGSLVLTQQQERWLIDGLLYVEIIDTSMLSIRGNLGTPRNTSNIEITQNYTIFYSDLNGNNMVPPTASSSFGEGLFYLDIIEKRLYWLVNLYNITGITQLTLRGPANSTQTGIQQINIGAVTAGSNNPIMASTALTEDQVQQLLSNSWYIQINTFTYLTGDIRGQLISIPITKALVEFDLPYEPTTDEITLGSSAVVNLNIPYTVILNPLSPAILPDSYIQESVVYNFVVPIVKFTDGFIFIECDGADYFSDAFYYTPEGEIEISYDNVIFWYLADMFIQIGNPDFPVMEAIVTMDIPFEGAGDIETGGSATVQYFYESSGNITFSEPDLEVFVMFNGGGTITLDDSADVATIFNNIDGSGEIIIDGFGLPDISFIVDGEIVLSGDVLINISPNVEGEIVLSDEAIISVFYNFVPQTTPDNIIIDGEAYLELNYIGSGEIILGDSSAVSADYLFEPIDSESILIYDATPSYEGLGEIVVNGEAFIDISPNVGGDIILDGQVELTSDTWSYETDGTIILSGGEDYSFTREFVYDSSGTIVINSFAHVVSVGDSFASGWGRYLRARTTEELIRERLLPVIVEDRGRFKESTAYCIPINNQKLGVCEIKSDRKIIKGAYVAKVTAKRQQPFMPCKTVPNENQRSCD